MLFELILYNLGGPLIIKSTTGSPSDDVLVGHSSWGYDCGSDEFPGVYTRTSSEFEWIQLTACGLTTRKDTLPFSCPTPSPTTSPTPAPVAPTTAPPTTPAPVGPNGPVVPVTILVTFDAYPGDISWTLVEDKTFEVVELVDYSTDSRYADVEGSDIAGTVDRRTFLLPEGGQYIFNIRDALDTGFEPPGTYAVIAGIVSADNTFNDDGTNELLVDGEKEDFVDIVSTPFTVPPASSLTKAPKPTPIPTVQPSPSPTAQPVTSRPTVPGETYEPTNAPTSAPTPRPTPAPSPQPTPSPATPRPTVPGETYEPTKPPTPVPSPMPSPAPTPVPTNRPSPSPTNPPVTSRPTVPGETYEPTNAPTPVPSPRPSPVPTPVPTMQPVTMRPTLPGETYEPTNAPTPAPSPQPTPLATRNPTRAPSPAPTNQPITLRPTLPGETYEPTSSPTHVPTPQPTPQPTRKPFSLPPSPQPTETPIAAPNTFSPTPNPTPAPTRAPILTPEPTPMPTISAQCCNGADPNNGAEGPFVGCVDDECEALVCDSLGKNSCCDTEWDVACVNAARQECSICQTNPPTVPPTPSPSVNTNSCCEGAESSSVDLSPPDGDELPVRRRDLQRQDQSTNKIRGCENSDCESQICQTDPFCCDFEWDSNCAIKARNDCYVCETEEPSASPSTYAPSSSPIILPSNSCCIGTPDGVFSPGCSDAQCLSLICESSSDAYCCFVDWDVDCAKKAIEKCGTLCIAFLSAPVSVDSPTASPESLPATTLFPAPRPSSPSSVTNVDSNDIQSSEAPSTDEEGRNSTSTSPSSSSHVCGCFNVYWTTLGWLLLVVIALSE